MSEIVSPGCAIRWREGRRRQAWAPYVMIAPAILLLALLILAPVALVSAAAFTDWQIGSEDAHYVGLDTFRALLSDPDFRKAVANTALYVAMVVPATTGLGLIAAVLLAGAGRMAPVYRAILFMPAVTTLAAMAISWQMLLSPSVGVLPQILRLLGRGPSNWLQDPDLALPILAVIGIWAEFGFAMLFFLAGLKTIPTELNDAATLDGIGGFFDRLWHVTLPHMAPISIFVVVFETIHALRSFDTVAVVTGGGPQKSTLLILYFIYRESFLLFRTNIAAAATVLFILVVLVLSIVQLRFGSRESAQ